MRSSGKEEPLVYGRRRKQKFKDYEKLNAVVMPKEEVVIPPYLAKIIDSFEQRRRLKNILFFMGATLTVVAAFFAYNSIPDRGLLATILFGGGYLSYLPLKMLKKQFKNSLIPQILSEYGFDYDQEAQGVFPSDYMAILPSYTWSNLSDHFWGSDRGIKMSVAEARLEKNFGKYTLTVFDGLLCRFDYPKMATAQVAVKSDSGPIEEVFNGVFTNKQRVRLEDPLFESKFEVYSRDQVGARYILTPTVMERLIALERQHNGLRAIFRNREVLLAIPDGPNLFNPGNFIRPLNRKMVQQFHQDVTIMKAFSDALKLNAKTKI